MAHHRHKRETNARRLLGASLPRLRATTVSAPLALAATAGVVSFGVLAADVSPVSIAAPAASGTGVGDTAAPAADLAGAVRREPTVTRGSSERVATPFKLTVQEPPTKLEKTLAPAAVAKAVRQADTRLWTSAALNLWTEPGDDAAKRGEIEAGEKVLVTGRELFGRVEIVLGQGKQREVRWVTDGYLTDQEPFTLGGDCTNGTSVASGVSPNIVKVHEAVCAAFPDITVYGTFRSDGEHSQGLAVDIMVSGAEGQAVADFVREYYAELGVNYVIYAQRIWSVDRSGEGWRSMEDRGSITANHYDHVHVTTY